MLLIGGLLAGCRTSPPCELLPQNNQTMMLMMESVLYFTVLKKAGVLPELAEKDHGGLQTMPVVDPSQTAFYPFSSKLTVEVEGKDVVYWYIMGKQDESAAWRVVKISKTDKNSRLLADNLPLPSVAAQADANAELKKLMEEWKNSQPAGGAYVSPAAGETSAHP